jgi:Integrase core domain
MALAEPIRARVRAFIAVRVQCLDRGCRISSNTLLKETNGQVERMNRTIKDATVKRYHYDDHDQLRRHLADFVAAYNFARRLKTLKGLTPFEFVSKCWTSEPADSNSTHSIKCRD